MLNTKDYKRVWHHSRFETFRCVIFEEEKRDSRIAINILIEHNWK